MISKETSRICVESTLQLVASNSSTPNPPIFALGDVADHNGPYMARAGWLQANVVANNIIAMIAGRNPSKLYKPNMFVEGAIKLTLGKSMSVLYAGNDDRSDILLMSRSSEIDLGIAKAWKHFGATLEYAARPG